MIRSVQESLVNWQLDRLQTLLATTRALLKQQEHSDLNLSSEHLKLAEERFAEALSALRYNRFDQALTACRLSLLQAGLAHALARYGATIDAGLKFVEEQSGKKRSEYEQIVAYSASALAQMKAAIEYANLLVSPRAQEILDNAMDYYNDAVGALKEGQEMPTLRAAQASLLSLALASRVLKMDNELVMLPAWRDLSNPMLASPVRGADDVVADLVLCREELSRATPAVATRARPHYEKALRQYNACIHALSRDELAHSQALLHKVQEEIDFAREILAEDLHEPDLAQPEVESWPQLLDVNGMLADIQELMEAMKARHVEHATNRLYNIKQAYKEARKAFAKQDYDEAESKAAAALLELSVVRRLLAATALPKK